MAKSNLHPLLLLASLAAVSLPATASAQDAGDEDVIIVEGERNIDGSDARQQARDITFPVDSYAEPLARFQRAICPGVWGMRPENAQLVIDRIYDNAEYVGAQINQTENCGANVWVIIVDDPAATYDAMLEKRDPLLRGLTKFERSRIDKQQGPVRAWHRTTTRDENGIEVATGFETASDFLAAKTGGSGAASPTPPAVSTTNMSRLRLPIREDLDMAIVLVARSALGSIDALALADYVSMRALARTEEPNEEDLLEEEVYHTILSLFDEDSAADRLTVFDRAYLRGLYRSGPYRPARMGVASLKPLMEEELNRDR